MEDYKDCSKKTIFIWTAPKNLEVDVYTTFNPVSFTWVEETCVGRAPKLALSQKSVSS